MVKIGDVWDRTTEFLGDNLRTVLPIAILALLIPTATANSLGELGQTAGQGLKVALAFLTLAFAILSLWAQLAIASLAIDGVGARRATERLLPAIGVYLLVAIAGGIIVTAIVVPAMIASGVDLSQMRAGSALRPFAAAPGVGLWLGLTLTAVMIGFLLLIVRLAPLSGLILSERRGAGAIPRAFRLTRGLTWKLVGVVILYAIVSIVAQWAAQGVFGSVLALIAGGEGPVTLAGVLTGAIVAAVQTAFTVLAAAFTAKLYLACVAREKTAIGATSLSKPL